jgi:hypothetical protein
MEVVRATRAGIALLAVGAIGLLLVVVLHRSRSSEAPPSAAHGVPAAEPAKPTGSGLVSGRVMGKYGTILGVPVRVLVDGEVTAECSTDYEGQYRLDAPAGVAFDLEARPETWTRLEPMRRTLRIEPLAEVTEDFIFGTSAGASGRMQGPVGQGRVTLFAIAVADYPASSDGWIPVGELRQAPKVIAEACGTFTFEDLDPSVTCRIAIDGYHWGLTRTVFLSPGDTGVTVPVERLLYFVVEASDIEGSGPLAKFAATVIDRSGEAHDRIEGKGGRLVHHARHPEQIPPDPPHLTGEELARRLKWIRAELLAGRSGDLPSLTEDLAHRWKLVVEAEGYFATTVAPTGAHCVFLQRFREPNVLLQVKGDDGTPFDGELEGVFEAAEQPDGKADARVAKEGPGRFRAVLPPGAWRIGLKRAEDESPAVHAEVHVPASGTVTVDAPRLPPERP